MLDFALYRLERGEFHVTDDCALPFDSEHVREMRGDFKTWKEVANYCGAHLDALRVPYFLLTGRENDKSLISRRSTRKIEHRPDAYNFAKDWRNSGLTLAYLLN